MKKLIKDIENIECNENAKELKNKLLIVAHEVLLQSNEKWLNTKYENYQVSNLGRVRFLGGTVIRKDNKPFNIQPKILKPIKGNANTRLITINKKDSPGKSHYVYIHRLVYETFNGDIGKTSIIHIDGNKENNQLSNLKLRGE